MPLVTFADYMGCLSLWMIPIFSAINMGLMLRKVVQTSSGRLVDMHKDQRLEQKVELEQKDFHHRMGDESIFISEIWNLRYVSISGENLFKKRALLMVVPGLDLIDDHAFQWLYKREFYYVINHVFIKIQMIKFLSMTIFAIILNMMMGFSYIPSMMGVLLAGMFLESVCRHIVENRADSFAKEHSSVEELQGGLRFLTAAHREYQLSSLAQKIFGCIMRPTYFFRMSRIRRALVKMEALGVVEEEKIAALRRLLAQNNLEETAFIEAKKTQVLRWIDADED